VPKPKPQPTLPRHVLPAERKSGPIAPAGLSHSRYRKRNAAQIARAAVCVYADDAKSQSPKAALTDQVPLAANRVLAASLHSRFSQTVCLWLHFKQRRRSSCTFRQSNVSSRTGKRRVSGAVCAAADRRLRLCWHGFSGPHRPTALASAAAQQSASAASGGGWRPSAAGTSRWLCAASERALAAASLPQLWPLARPLARHLLRSIGGGHPAQLWLRPQRRSASSAALATASGSRPLLRPAAANSLAAAVAAACSAALRRRASAAACLGRNS